MMVKMSKVKTIANKSKRFQCYVEAVTIVSEESLGKVSGLDLASVFMIKSEEPFQTPNIRDSDIRMSILTMPKAHRYKLI